MTNKDEEEIKKLFDYAEFMYKQPRDSNGDNAAFLTICMGLGDILSRNRRSGGRG